MTSIKTSKRNYAVDFLRFVFSVMIVYYHVYSNIADYAGTQTYYEDMSVFVKWSCLVVECFLIMGGYYLYSSAQRSKGTPYIKFALGKVFRLLPVFAVCILISLVVGKTTLQDAIFQASFLQCTGISLVSKGIIWYIGPFFLSSLFLGGLIRNVDKKKLALILAVISYFGYAICINDGNGGELSREVTLGFVSMAMARALSGMSVGIFIAMLSEQYGKYIAPNKKESVLFRVLWSVAEVASLALMLKLMLFGHDGFNNSFIIVILFSLFFFININDKGILSRVYNFKPLGLLGNYSYSIYVMQPIGFYILQNTLYKNSSFVQDHALYVTIISVVSCLVLGVVTYYIIEKPFTKLGKKYLGK